MLHPVRLLSATKPTGGCFFFLIVYFLGRKGFCRFICPWGAFLKLPTALAIYKVRTNGGCIQTGNCTKNCPIGIDVSFEINEYNKVVNTNCTNCMICTEGCPSQTLAYSFKNPMNEKISISDFFKDKDQYSLSLIFLSFLQLQN